MEKDTFTSKAYHNTLARYNGYFLAKEKMKEVEATVAESSPDNFSRTLKVYPSVTSGTVSAINPDLEEIIKKASLPIQRHKNSRWVDNSYTMVGRARYYKLDYDNAAITFKYVNSKGEDDDDKHEALTWLLRTFVQTEQYDNAFSVVSHLSKKELTPKNKELYALAKAELYQKIEENTSFLKSMQESADVVKNRNNKARINFIMGQLNQAQGNNEDSYKNYTVSIRKSPTYEMAFYAKLYRTQVTDLNKKDPKKVIKYYKKLLRDEKNIDYKDKIYFEMAKFEYKQEKIPSSLEYLNGSLRANTNNLNQKAYSYLMAAEIYYDDLRHYRNASKYYDSTYTILNKEEKKYPIVKKRAEVLKEFVKQWTIVVTEDSLQKLAKMDSSELYALINKNIEEEEEASKLLKEKEKKAKEAELNNANGGSNNNLNLLSNAQGGRTSSTWYFYNANVMNRGKMTFKQKWGERELSDNWRRESKEKVDIEEEDLPEETEIAANSNNPKDNVSDEEMKSNRFKKKRNDRLKTIPFDDKALEESNERLQEALYLLGGIYHLKLEEIQHASDTYEKVAERFPNHEKITEVYYILYIINKEPDLKKSNYYKNLLLSKYPNSVYAKLVLDPEYLIKNEQLNKRAQGQYAIAYEMHVNEKFQESFEYCDKTIIKFPETDIMDKIVFLKALNMGLQDTTVLIFKNMLDKFIVDFPSSDLVPLAQEYLKGVANFMNKKISSSLPEPMASKVEFTLDMKQNHFFISVFKKGKLKKHKVVNKYAQYNDANYSSDQLRTKPQIFGTDKFIIQILEFKDGKRALDYYNSLNVAKDILDGMPDKNHDSFVISEDNYTIFYKGAYLSEYISFFREKYIVNGGKEN